MIEKEMRKIWDGMGEKIFYDLCIKMVKFIEDPKESKLITIQDILVRYHDITGKIKDTLYFFSLRFDREKIDKITERFVCFLSDAYIYIYDPNTKLSKL